ncbi:MAG: hypothetical protein ACIAQZ_00880 [Sedimentisphaeraceae bacterium JB056]
MSKVIVFLVVVAVSISYGSFQWIYCSESFEGYQAGTVNAQSGGFWNSSVPVSSSSPYYGSWRVVSGSNSNSQIVDLGGDYDYSLSLSGQSTYTNLQLGWLGNYSYPGQIQTVVIEYEFYQDFSAGNLWNYLETLRNSQQVVLTQIYPENGHFKVRLRRDSKTSAITTYDLASYSGQSWHSVRIEQTSPIAEDYGQVKIWLDDTEITSGYVYYTQWPTWNGYIDAIQLNANAAAGTSYYIDNFRVGVQAGSDYYPNNLNKIGFWETVWPVNVANVATDHFTHNLCLAMDAANRGMNSYINIKNVFAVETWDASNQWCGYDMRSDYQQCWKTFKDLVSSIYQQGRIYGFQLPDEAVWNGLSVSEVDVMADAVKADFADSKVYYNEALAVWEYGTDLLGSSITYTQFSDSVDYISADWYNNLDKVRYMYNKYIFPAMYDDQLAILVPDAFGSNNNPNKTLAQYQTAMISMANDFYGWATANGRIAGMFPWHYGNRPFSGAYEEIGIVGMSQLKTEWESIASEINDGFTWSPQSWIKPVQEFDSFSNNESLPSTYAWDPWSSLQTPSAPSVNNVSFSTDKSYSGTTSIKMKTQNAAFRYCWGTNDRNVDGRIWDWTNDTMQNIEFMVYVQSPISLYVRPYRNWYEPCKFFITGSGLGFADASGSSYVANWSDFNVDDWNKVSVKIDTNSDNLQIKLNGVEKYNSSFSKYTTPQMESDAFTTVGFINYASNSNVWLDDIAMWYGNYD